MVLSIPFAQGKDNLLRVGELQIDIWGLFTRACFKETVSSWGSDTRAVGACLPACLLTLVMSSHTSLPSVANPSLSDLSHKMKMARSASQMLSRVNPDIGGAHWSVWLLYL